MAITRRRALAAAASLPVAALGTWTLANAGSLIAAATRGARPAADGTSATRCGQCGSPDHAMLHPGCPLAPRVRA